MTRSENDATSIAEHLLSQTGLALLSGDFESFSKCFQLPQVLGTFEGSNTIENEGELRTLFDGMVAYYRSEQVSELVRNCIAAEFKDADTIESTHQSRILRNVELIQRPFTVFSVLKRMNDNWRIVSSQYAVTDAPVYANLLSGAQGNG